MQSGIRTLAGKYDSAFVELQKPLDEAIEKLGPAAITIDGVHLTEEGQRLLADCLLKELRKYFKNERTDQAD